MIRIHLVVTRRSSLIAVSVVVVALVCGGVAYVIGASNAPSTADAQTQERKAYVTALAGSREDAYTAARISGRREGLEQGAKLGRVKGSRTGRQDGERARAEEAAAQEAATPEGIPGLVPGETLPPIPDGADEPNPEELCAQAPLSAEQLGYYCP